MNQDFANGAIAMRDRIADGVHRWWERARKHAGHRFPGHPHWLEVAIRKIDPESVRDEKA